MEAITSKTIRRKSKTTRGGNTKGRRPKIPPALEYEVLLANRHSCCVCQKPRVQLHHIDGNPSNNIAANLAPLCLDHHDMATMQIGLTKKLQPDDVKTYKDEWEEYCRGDIRALSRARFTFYYCIYKNPQRLIGALSSLSVHERVLAAEKVRDRLIEEEPRKLKDSIYGLNAVPRKDDHTGQALDSFLRGETTPSYLTPADLKFDPAETYHSPDHYMAYHKYDLWCQIVGQILAEARGTTPVEDFLKFKTAKEVDRFAGSLVTFFVTIRGKGVVIPRRYRERPTALIYAKAKDGSRKFRIEMQLRTRDLFSDTAAMNLTHGRVSGLAILSGALVNKGEIKITLVPLLIGTGGWNIYPEKY
jgi:hypothetical protein